MEGSLKNSLFHRQTCLSWLSFTVHPRQGPRFRRASEELTPRFQDLRGKGEMELALTLLSPFLFPSNSSLAPSDHHLCQVRELSSLKPQLIPIQGEVEPDVGAAAGT